MADVCDTHTGKGKFQPNKHFPATPHT